MKLPPGASLVQLSGPGHSKACCKEMIRAPGLCSPEAFLPSWLFSACTNQLVISSGLNYIRTQELVPTYILFPHILGEICSRTFHPGDTGFRTRVAWSQSILHSAHCGPSMSLSCIRAFPLWRLDSLGAKPDDKISPTMLWPPI